VEARPPSPQTLPPVLLPRLDHLWSYGEFCLMSIYICLNWALCIPPFRGPQKREIAIHSCKGKCWHVLILDHRSTWAFRIFRFVYFLHGRVWFINRVRSSICMQSLISKLIRLEINPTSSHDACKSFVRDHVHWIRASLMDADRLSLSQG